MATVHINGIGNVQVDDSFLSMSPDEQARAIDEIGATVRGQGQVSQMTAFGRGAAQGITFNFWDELRGLMEAGGLKPDDPASLWALISGATKYFGGSEEASKRYERGAERVRQELAAAQQQHPYTTMAGELTGAAAFPVGGAARAAGLGARIGYGALAGAGYGALAGVGAGETPTGRAIGAGTGAVVGGATGAAVPAVAAGVKAGVGNLVNRFRGATNPTGTAARLVGEARQTDIQMGKGGITEPEFAALQAEGAPVANVDIGGVKTQALAHAAANISPEARSILEDFADTRFRGQVDRVSRFVTRLTGHAGDLGEKADQIKALARKANPVEYMKSYKAGDYVLDSPLLKEVSNIPDVQSAMRIAERDWKKFRFLDGFGDTDPTIKNLQFWDYTARALEKKAKSSKDFTLSALAGRIKTELDSIVPEFKNARTVAKGFFGQRDALEAGAHFMNMRDLPGAERAVKSMNKVQRALFAYAFVGDFLSKLSKRTDKTDVVNRIMNSNDSRLRFRIALPKEQATAIENYIQIEAIMDKLRKALGGSSTARNLAEMSLLTTGAFGTDYYLTGNPVTAAAHTGLAMGIFSALKLGNKSLNAKIAKNLSIEVAKLLVSDNPASVTKGLEMVNKSKPLTDAIHRVFISLTLPGAAIGATTAAIQK